MVLRKPTFTLFDVSIDFHRNEDLKVALWGDLALGFETNKVFQIVPPVVIVITGTKVRPSSGMNKSYDCLFSYNCYCICGFL